MTFLYLGGAGRDEFRGNLPSRKNKCRKIVLFSNGMSSNHFPEIVENSIFLLHFHQKLSKFSKNFPTICVFRPKPRKNNEEFA